MNNQLKKKEITVALMQDYIGYGGRIVVLSQIIKILNLRGITPELVGFKVHITKQEIKKRYNIDINFTKRELKLNIFKKFNEFNKIWFNLNFRLVCKQYNLIINSNNTTCFSQKSNTIFYIHFPRLKRVKTNEYLKVNYPIKLHTRIALHVDYYISRILYNFDYLKKYNYLIANSVFTRNSIAEVYNYKPEMIEVIYPPVNFNITESNKAKKIEVVSVGRISALKNQLLQLQMAKVLKDMHFHIIGFADSNDPYYIKCLNYIRSNSISNVSIHTNVNYDQLVMHLKNAKFYLHTTVNEPFGITTVEAISYGCIPVVHNSGGQIEIVPNKDLRFNNSSEAVQIIAQLSNADNNTLVMKLQDHINIFSIKNFNNIFVAYLNTLQNQ